MAEMTKTTGKTSHDKMWAKAWFRDGTWVRVSFGRTGERLSASIGVDTDSFDIICDRVINGWIGDNLGDKMIGIRTAMKVSADAMELAMNLRKVLI